MEEKTLKQFIQRILSTSPNSECAQMALRQLESILSEELSGRDRQMLQTVLAGTADSLQDMQLLKEDFTNADLMTAVDLARETQQRIRREQAERYGRC